MKAIGSVTKTFVLAAALVAPGMCQCLIHGSSQPDAIPDDKAYGLMLGTLKLGPTETPAHNQARVSAYLALIGLNLAPSAIANSINKDFILVADHDRASLAIALATFLTAALVAVYLRGFLKLLPILIGVIVGFAPDLLNDAWSRCGRMSIPLLAGSSGGDTRHSAEVLARVAKKAAGHPPGQ